MSYYLVSFDLEATGLSKVQDQIVEFGAIVHLWSTGSSTFVPVSRFVSRVRPTVRHMGGKASEITGITMDMLKDAPGISHVLMQFQTHLETHCTDTSIPRILVAYNGFGYDIPLLVAELVRAGTDPVAYVRSLRLEYTLDMLIFARSHFDTTHLRRNKSGSCSYRLSDVYAAVCNKPLDGAHGALADSQAVLDIMQTSDTLETLGGMLSSGTPGRCLTNVMTMVRGLTKPPAKKTTSKRLCDMVHRKRTRDVTTTSGD